jgi:hypothetical protein
MPINAAGVCKVVSTGHQVKATSNFVLVGLALIKWLFSKCYFVEFFSAIPWTCNKRLKGFENIELLLFVQECHDYHQAKDGDGWVERSNQSFFFGIF